MSPREIEVSEPREVGITELVLRDAHQSLMATRMAMEDMVGACADIDAAGYWSVECWGGATYDSCIRFLNEDPWERLRTFRKLMPNSRLQMLLRGQNLLGYRHYNDEVVDRFVDKSAENGMDVFRVFDAMNDPRNMAHAMAAVKKAGKHAQGTICYTISPVHTVEGYVKLAGQLLDMGADSIALKDMAALLKPQPAYDIIKAIKDTYGQKTQINLHCHSTTGVTEVSLMKAIEAGVDVVDTAISSMSLGPGHNPTESVAEMLEGTGYTTNLDYDRLHKIRDHFKAIRPKYKKFESKTLVDTSIFKSQIPGGMLSNMESQLRAQGAEDKMDEVMAEVPRVRKAAGFPPLVTPSSQIVGTQAVFNVMMGEYKRMTGEFADIMLGYYGASPADRDPKVVKLAEEQSGKKPITQRPADLLPPEWEKQSKEAAALKGFNGTDEDVLTYALFPQVAPVFFEHRAEGPHSVALTDAQLKAEAEGDEKSLAVAGPVTYNVNVGGTVREVTVQQA
ncbi:methylmalonyl-CoA carboxytransferase subunit 5S [Propionibacterium freudenreichii]|uniref:methylmalonyl-CoA carboxytransferase subunit 5S n=1 Tax=Propionibacterium freudenreichii TaxID=1744 RepID=UPI00054424AD|nr:methylmalonyl-CoA carboxytransferase subunit 5S [Propionibacterium freudenreichii]MCT2978097.1 oxaloacetate decarboxylase [Propionibacterium freudenreichii]MCT2987333.1 oxaloacetate decarboxylase [Propionibacterium freudenreichii]MCT2988289.1 oxaloacetate decarboxylase [Propionibacterium freudenreichii]MDK9296181.1 methylmalonyl-CoA carboxytransferase subunit 5S [Propionibacterium freudenreichii]MDK9353500.1 methylmalonyl-CoA carboxytransferase subunit 5S [Propionibacterium freudenreichii]